jgi:peptidoglycan/LPS O-acetylase OafA/YrhL
LYDAPLIQKPFRAPFSWKPNDLDLPSMTDRSITVETGFPQDKHMHHHTHSPPSRINGVIDLARMVAAGGIVLFHIGAPGAAIGYAGLPFFLILTVMLAGRTAGRQHAGAFATDRARRLLRPWLIWSGVFGALKLAEVAMTDATLGSEFAPHMILTGTAIHLWFLPFAFVACMAAWVFVRTNGSNASAIVWLISLLCIGVAAVFTLRGTVLPVPLAQWVFALPAIVVGLAFAVQPDGTGTLTGMVMCLTLCAVGWMWEGAGTVQLLVAGGVILACRVIHLPAGPLLRRAGDAALGVYLVHPLVASVLTRAGGMEHQSLALAGMTFALSLAFSIGTGMIGRSGTPLPR